MSKVVSFLTPVKATVIDRAYMEQFSNDQLAYKAWEGADFALEVYLDEEKDSDSTREADFELVSAVLAMRVLAHRLIGMDPIEVRQKIHERFLQSALQEQGDGDEH